LSAADDEFGEKTVSVLLDGEESEMIFIDHPSVEMSVSRFHIAQQRTEKL
jgi:Rad/Gem-related GTP binding protein 1